MKHPCYRAPSAVKAAQQTRRRSSFLLMSLFFRHKDGKNRSSWMWSDGNKDSRSVVDLSVSEYVNVCSVYGP